MSIDTLTCDWCGHAHAREALCAARPKWSRRGFLALFGAGIAGAALGGVQAFAPAPAVVPTWAAHAPKFEMVMAQMLTPGGLEDILRRVGTVVDGSEIALVHPDGSRMTAIWHDADRTVVR